MKRRTSDVETFSRKKKTLDSVISNHVSETVVMHTVMTQPKWININTARDTVPYDCNIHFSHFLFLTWRDERKSGKKTYDFWLELRLREEWRFCTISRQEKPSTSWGTGGAVVVVVVDMKWNEIYKYFFFFSISLLFTRYVYNMYLSDENVQRHAVGCQLSLVYHNRYSLVLVCMPHNSSRHIYCSIQLNC